jgi:Flp pilus assembly protein TadG
MMLSKHLHRLREDQRGTVAVIMGLLIVPLVGALGIGFEVSNWYMNGRGMQNAADAAALAAATNGGANYDVEAKAVAAQYGFVDGVNSIAVAASNAAACPDGVNNNCYSVTISGAVPLLVSQIVGYRGDTTLNGAAAKQLSSSAIASHPNTPVSFCLLALGPQGIRSNGAPKASMACNTMSNAGSTCNGGNLGAPIGAAHNTNKNCGVHAYSNVPAAADTYAALASNIPADSCGGSYPQEPGRVWPFHPPSVTCACKRRELHQRGDERIWWKQVNLDPLPIAQRLWQHTRMKRLRDPIDDRG